MPEKSLKELVRSIESKEIDIPELQREFVWTNEKVKDLASSIYNKYPIGLLTLYKLPKKLSQEIGSQYWVLDGQQRLLALTLIFNGVVTLGNGKQKRLWIWFNPREEIFKFTEPPRRLSNEWVNLAEILNMDDEKIIEFIQNKTPEEQKKIRLLWSRFQDYKMLVHEISEDLELDKLGEIFVRINFAGTRVKGTDVYSTMVAIMEPGTVKRLRSFCKKLENETGWDIDYGVIIRSFIAFLTDGKVRLASKVLEQASKLKECLDNKRDEIEKIMSKMEDCVTLSILLLSGGLGISRPTSHYFPTQNVLVTMAYYLSKREELLDEDVNGLLKWFILASEFGRYSSATETRLNEDLTLIKDGKDYQTLISKLEEYTGDLKERIKENIRKGYISELVLYSFLKMNKAKDLRTKNELTTVDITTHHIFPRSRLLGSEFEDLIDDVGNLTLTTMGTNNYFLNKDPENYLPKIPKEIRDSHFIPDEPSLWKIENFRQFLEKRKELLMKAADDFFGTSKFINLEDLKRTGRE